jgi:hypothetical protein
MIPVDGDVKEGQVWHARQAEVILLHQYDSNGHMLHGGTLCLTTKVCSHWAPTHDADAGAQRHHAAQARQDIIDHQYENMLQEQAQEEANRIEERKVPLQQSQVVVRGLLPKQDKQ